MIYTLVALSLCGWALAVSPGTDSCPALEVVQDFDVSRFLGRWFEAEKYFTTHGTDHNCGTSEYSPGKNGTINVFNGYISGLKLHTMTGVAHIPDLSQPAKWRMKFSSEFEDTEVDYWILGTDYESFAVVYSCLKLGTLDFMHPKILTRNRNPPNEVIVEAYEIVNKHKFKKFLFHKVHCSLF